jgi:hypothetical protein
VGESQPLAVELENPHVERLGEPSVEAGTESCFHETGGRICEGRDGACDL